MDRTERPTALIGLPADSLHKMIRAQSCCWQTRPPMSIAKANSTWCPAPLDFGCDERGHRCVMPRARFVPPSCATWLRECQKHAGLPPQTHQRVHPLSTPVKRCTYKLPRSPQEAIPAVPALLLAARGAMWADQRKPACQR
jgi:hypothetical protein